MAFNVSQPRDARGRFGSIPRVIPPAPTSVGVVFKPAVDPFVVPISSAVSLGELFRIFEMNRVSSGNDLQIVVNDANEWSRSYHLKFDNFPEDLTRVTFGLFAARPSLLPDLERRELFEGWVVAASEVYGLIAPEVVWSESEVESVGGGLYRRDSHEIFLNPVAPSLTTLFHEFRHALQFHKLGDSVVSDDVERDARAWSLSLYFCVKPKLFAKFASEGRFFNVDSNIFS